MAYLFCDGISTDYPSLPRKLKTILTWEIVSSVKNRGGKERHRTFIWCPGKVTSNTLNEISSGKLDDIVNMA